MQAQTISSSLDGTVTDSTGAIVPETGVTLTDIGTGMVLKTKTDGSGRCGHDGRVFVAAGDGDFNPSDGLYGSSVVAARCEE